MGDFDSVVCPRCKVGFSPDTAVCPVCHIPLVPEEPLEDGSEDQLEGPPVALILTDDLSSLKELRTADPEWIYHLQEKLVEAEIPHRIEASGRRLKRCTVYVRQEDLVKAKEIDDKIFEQEVPDGEGMSRPEELDFWTCPGCGYRLGENDLKCSSCGLVLQSTEGWRCPDCDGIVNGNVKVCPHCGAEID